VPEVSVVVPVKNGMPWLEEQLVALSDQDFAGTWELVIADNGSTDGSREVINHYSEKFDSLQMIDASSVRGPAAVRNLGVQSAKSALLAFCDADDVVSSRWLSTCVLALADADAIGGSFDPWSLNELGAPAEPAGAVVPPAKRQFGFLEAGLSSNLAVRREVFLDLGGFDEELVVGEDTDFCWRAQLMGYRFDVAPEAVVKRRERSSAKEMFRRHVAYGECGPVLFKRHRASGLRRETREAARSWAWILATSPRLISQPEIRSQWLRLAAWRTGRLIGSVREGVFFP
jgi:GT2 family glycosyltransferase